MNLSRRAFLLGSASAVALAACGGGDDDDDDDRPASAPSSTTTTSAAAAAATSITIARVFAPSQLAGVPLRLPIALADADGALLDDVPASITARWGLDAGSMSDAIEITRRGDGIPTPYFPLTPTFPTEGEWRIEIDVDGEPATTTVEAVGREEAPAVPGPGEPLLALQTPTTADDRGVDPICTRDPACPFHTETLESAMASGKAIAFIIATPQFCQTAICGPVLDLLVERQPDFDTTVAFVHAEVYTDSTARTPTEAVRAYGLTYEPALWLAAPDGTITARLDYTYDGSELDEELAKLVP